VDSQHQEPSEVKTHDEIMNLFKELEVMQAKVKNPQEFIKEIIKSPAFVQEVDPSIHLPGQTIEQQYDTEPAYEIPHTQGEHQRRRFWTRNHQQDPSTPPESIQKDQAQEVRIPPPSTFVLQLDSNGNLVGLPVKKQKLQEERNQEEEPETGIKGKFKHLGNRFHRKNSSEDESDEGIGSKLLGIFRRGD